MASDIDFVNFVTDQMECTYFVYTPDDIMEAYVN
jgi:hypothetical protein